MNGVDGTISQTDATPEQAEVTPLCRHYLSILSQLLALVAAVSGRRAVEVDNLVGIDGMVYIGNLGLEGRAEGEQPGGRGHDQQRERGFAVGEEHGGRDA